MRRKVSLTQIRIKSNLTEESRKLCRTIKRKLTLITGFPNDTMLLFRLKHANEVLIYSVENSFRLQKSTNWNYTRESKICQFWKL